MSANLFSAQQYCKFSGTKPIQIINGRKMTAFQPGSEVVDSILVKSLNSKSPFYLALTTQHSMILFNGETVIKQIQESAEKLAASDHMIIGISKSNCVLWNTELDTTSNFDVEINDKISSCTVSGDKLVVGTTQLLVFSLQSMDLIASTSRSHFYIDKIVCHKELIFAISHESNAINLFKMKKDKRRGKKLVLVDTVFVDCNIKNICIFNGYMTITNEKSFSVFEVNDSCVLKSTTTLNKALELSACDLDKNGELQAHLFIEPYSSYLIKDYKSFPNSIFVEDSVLQTEMANPKIAIMDQLEPNLGDLIPVVQPQDEQEIILESTSTSLTPLLLQAIKGQDQTLLETCLQSQPHLVKKALKKLTPPAVTGLVHLLNQRLQKQLTKPVMAWVSDLLLFHGSSIRTGPAAKDIYMIESLLAEKAKLYEAIVDVAAQLEMSLAIQEDLLISEEMDLDE
eukprot:NODE_687_length_5167_cov_0.378453.p1 type:complete len:455 gc:universal NODE_687_length_5167_cov_0.378453:2561-1197(-)